MKNDTKYRQDYMAFMQDIIEKGYGEKAPQEQRHNDDGKLWYIPHHGVYHPQKPDKIRVVFDCSATFMGHSLNKYLLPSPDLTNSLVGVLSRFRQEMIAFMCGLEAMFHQFKVAEEDRDLRFYWWENGDTTRNPVQDPLLDVRTLGSRKLPLTMKASLVPTQLRSVFVLAPYR